MATVMSTASATATSTPQPGEPVGIGFIGAGEISILHNKALKSIPGARLVGLWNRTPERALQRAAEYGCRRYETPEELVADPAIGAVFVLT